MSPEEKRKAHLEEEKKRLIESCEHIYEAVEEYCAIARRRSDRIELALLIFSAITSGALWTLLTGSLPNIMAWIGSVLSTAVTVLTIYQKTLGPKKLFESAAKIYQSVGEFLAELKADPDFQPSVYWKQYKFIQQSLICIEWKALQKKGRPPVLK